MVDKPFPSELGDWEHAPVAPCGRCTAVLCQLRRLEPATWTAAALCPEVLCSTSSLGWSALSTLSGSR